MFKFVKRWKLWYARYQLSVALNLEETSRLEAGEAMDEAKRLRHRVIPALEKAVKTAEKELVIHSIFGA